MRGALPVAAAAMLCVASPAASRLAPPPLADHALDDPAAEAQAAALMAQIRCLVCEGQSIADSDAAMAADLRAIVRARIAAGEAPEDVRAWLVARYGREVSYRPPLAPGTALLWAAPLLLLGGGLLVARATFRRSGARG